MSLHIVHVFTISRHYGTKNKDLKSTQQITYSKLKENTSRSAILREPGIEGIVVSQISMANTRFPQCCIHIYIASQVNNDTLQCFLAYLLR